MDPPEDPGYEPLPERIAADARPLAAACPATRRPFGFEVKWDGMRAIAYVRPRPRARCRAATARDFTPRYPELRELGRALGARRVVLDGEVVAFDETGGPSFERLQSRMHLASDSAVRRRMQRHAGDLRDLRPALPRRPLHDGRSPTRSAASCSRALELEGPAWRTPGLPPRRGRGAARGHARRWASRASSPSGSTARTSPGRALGTGSRSRTCTTQDVVIGGWTPGEGGRSRPPRRAGRRRMEDGELRYAGKVGTGFTEQTLALAEARARAAAGATTRRSAAASRRRARVFVGAGARGRTSSSASGRRAGPCARRPSRACGRTWTRRIACARRVNRRPAG